MKPKTKNLLIAAASAGIGGALGAVSGSRNWIVVAIVSAVFGGLAAWSMNGLIKQ